MNNRVSPYYYWGRDFAKTWLTNIVHMFRFYCNCKGNVELYSRILLYTYPEIVGELQRKDGDALIVKRASDRAGDIARDDGNEAGRQQPCTLVPQLAGQQEGGDGGQTTKHWCQKDTHVPDVDRDVKQIEDIVDETGSRH